MRYLLCTIAVAACLATPVLAEDCIDVQLTAARIEGDPLERLQLFYALDNCGGAGMVTLTFSVERNGELVGEIETSRFLQAGQSVRLDLRLPIPPVVPPGDCRLCAGASLGTASDSACALITLDAVGNVLSFTAEMPVPVTPASWGAMKKIYRE